MNWTTTAARITTPTDIEQTAINCPEGTTLVNCRHDEGFSNAWGECKQTEFLSYTPFCPTPFTQVNQLPTQVAIGLGGFSYNELFGVPDQRYVPNFQCRQECIGFDEDTSYCGGPFACGTAACSGSFARDGEVDFRNARGCPVVLDDDVEIDAAIRWKVGQTCVDCDNCGLRTPADVTSLLFAVDWGLGCAVECSRLLCDIGDIYDFTDQRCKRCEQLQSKRTCSQAVQKDLQNTDVSGNDVLLRRDGCLGKPGAFEYEDRQYVLHNVTSPDPTYGECIECQGPSNCQDNEYAASCDECLRCVPHGIVQMQQRTWRDLEGEDRVLFCQMPECAPGLTGLRGHGDVCIERCNENLECSEDEWVVACSLPHNSRCRKRWPLVGALRVSKGIVADTVDLLEDSSHFASFENAQRKRAYSVGIDKPMC